MPARHKVFITYSALDNGILVKYVDDICSTESPMKVYDNESDISTNAYVSLDHIHATQEAAMTKAEDMRTDLMLDYQTKMRDLYEYEIKVIT